MHGARQLGTEYTKLFPGQCVVGWISFTPLHAFLEVSFHLVATGSALSCAPTVPEYRQHVMEIVLRCRCA